MKLQNILKQATKELGNFNTGSLDARILLQHVTKYSLEEIYLKPELEISSEINEEFQKLVMRRKAYEPVAKIIGYKSFWKNDFLVNQHTLDPRPDSEVIIQAAIELFDKKDQKLEILDLGTGTGCLLYSLLEEFPNAVGIGVDISENALKVAEQNLQLLSLQNRVKLLKNNWADGIVDKFDLIVSNPPYISENEMLTLDQDVKLYDPEIALVAGIDGLIYYRYLAKQIFALLKNDGYAIFEFGYSQAEAIKKIFIENSFKIIDIINDLNGHQRAIILSLNNV